MAVNKRKILASAQKHLQKGALDKALKDYQTALKADPKDSNVRLKIGDILLRQGSRDQAIDAYRKVAERFMDDGFDAKAVAIFKQISKIDAKRYDIFVPLSELYQRMGLISEAMGALQTAADGYHREGRKHDALDLLRKMADLDPTNTTSRLKIADVLRQEGLEADAIAEYCAVIAECERQENSEGVIAAAERILELAPKNTEILGKLARTHFESGNAERAEPAARRLAELDPDAAEPHELLAQIYTRLGRAEEQEKAYRTLAAVYRQRGDDDKAREILQRFGTSASFQADSGDAGLDFGDLQSADDERVDPLLEEPVLELDTPELEEEPSEELLTDDPEQVLAEASVYLRYGKRDKAVESLEALVERHPDHLGALEKLGEACAAAKNVARASEVWLRAAELARAAGDAAAVAALRDRIAAVDPEAAARLSETGGAESGAAPEPTEELVLEDADADDEFVLEIEDDDAPAEDDDVPAEDDDVPAEDAAAAEADAGEASESPADSTEALASDELELDIDVELDVDESASAPPDATSDAADDSDASEPDEVSVPAAAPTEAHEPQPAEAQRSAQTSGGRARSAATRQKIAEDLEEAEFYFNQEFYDEARKIYERVLSMDPNQPQAMLRMGEIAKVCGEPPDPKPAARPAPEPAAAAPVEHPEASADDTEEASADEAEEASADDPDVAMQDATDEPTLDDADEDLDLDIDVDDEDLEPDDSTESEISAPTGAVLRGADPAKLREAAVEQTEPIAEAAGETAESDADEPEEDHGEFQAMVDELSDESDADAPAEEEAVAEDGFDLARELQGALANDEPSTGSEAAETAEEGFESIFRDFKQGVDRTLGEGDLDTHYDLGIAYREMGLIDDAIAEFRLTLGLPERRLDSLHMLGLCALEVGRPPDAIAHFEQALAEPALPDAQRTALRFDLGRAHEENGDTARARSMYELVAESDSDFCDVSERLIALGDEDGLISAELGAEDGAEEEIETFESFDDVIAEAEAVIGGREMSGPEASDPADGGAAELAAETAEDVPEAVPAVEVESLGAPEDGDSGDPASAPPAESAPPEPRGRRSKKRKKKISFV